MLHILTHDILPVFFMLALGFAMGRGGKAGVEEARALNRIAFLVFQPGLIFPLVAQVDLVGVDLGALGSYVLAEVATFTAAFLLAWRVLGRDMQEAWLLGMATIFVNSLLYILPISQLIYGPDAVAPVTAIVAWDSTGSFAFFIISAALMARTGSLGRSLAGMATNPVLIAIVLGIVLNLSGLNLPEPVLTACQFAGKAAPPMMLFALGVILSGQSLKPGPVVTTISAIKLIGFPVLVWLGLMALAPASDWTPQFVLTAAGPSGAMAFSLAMLHGVRTDTIAPVIIWTSVLSLLSLAALA